MCGALTVSNTQALLRLQFRLQIYDVIALKKLATWKTYIPGDFICVVVTSEYKVLRKVSVSQPDEQSINFTQMVDGTPVESSIPKDIIVEIYKVVGNYRRQ